MPDPERNGSGDRQDAPRSALRTEDARLLTGRGRFVADIHVDHCLHASFVRSPVAYGTIESVHVDEARAAAGVAAVFTGEDTGGVRGPGVNPIVPAMLVPRFPVFAVAKVMAVGEPVAAVIAETAAAAADAAECVNVEVTSREPVLDAGAAGEDLFCDVPGNESLSRTWSCGDVEGAFGAADEIVRVQVEHARVAPAALEPRACLAVPDTAAGTLTVWLSTQTPHRARSDIADALGVDEARVRVIAPDVGGAFGMKASLYPEELLVAWAAFELGRPVRWVATRSEEMLSATQGRGARLRGELALARDGRMLGLRARAVFAHGHWLPFSAAVPPWNAGRILPGPYLVEAVDISTRALVTNTAAVGIYRGAGRPEAAVLMERLVEEGARVLGMDPAELRRRNFVPADRFPYRTPTGELFDSGDYAGTFERACGEARYRQMRAEQNQRRAAGELVGIGTAFYVEPSGRGWESARVVMDARGRVQAASGSSAQGQGRETAYAQIVADALGVSSEHVEVIHGDTMRCPKGIGALASRSTPIGGSAMAQAARELVESAKRVAARLLQADEAAVQQVAGGFCLRADPGRRVDWKQVAGSAEQEDGALESSVRYEVPGEAWGCGCCIVLVCVDPDTGVARVERMAWVDDAGNVINPRLVNDQLAGGIAQGLGETLMERVAYDDDGQLLSGSFMDYAMPRASDMPPVTFARTVTPSPHNLLGAKGVGEAGTIGTVPAVLNAVLDALAPLGVGELPLPLTGERIWRAMRDATSKG